MSRDDPPDQHDDGPPDPDPAGTVHATSAGAIAGFALAGLLLGGSLRSLALSQDMVAPRVGWVPVSALFLAAAVMAGVAWSTHDVLHRRGLRIEPHRAVNRLVLAKATALAGALVSGGYLGYAVSWVGRQAGLAGERLLHSLLAALGAALSVGAALLVERALRVSGDREGRDRRQ